MINTLLKRLLNMLLLLSFQVLILNHVQISGYGTPLVFACMILYMPMGSVRTGILLWGFCTGMLVDIFSNTPGVASGSMTFAALIQQPLLRLTVPRDAPENIEPSMQNMGTGNFVRYAMLLMLFHHLVYYGLESFSLYHMTDAVLLMLTSWVSSVLLALFLEAFRRKN